MPNQWFANLETDLRSTLLDFAERALLHHNGNVERAAQDCQAKFALEFAHARFAVQMADPDLQVTLCSLWLSMFTLTSACSQASYDTSSTFGWL